MDAAPLAPARFSLRQLTLSGLSALAGFILMAGLINRVLPPLEVREISTKLRTYTRDAAKYDTVILGSSHVLTQIDPRIFDAEMARHGIPTHTYNFGVTGLAGQETRYLAEQLFAPPRTPHLRYVIIEVAQDRFIFPEMFRDTTREIYGHDLGPTWVTSRQILFRITELSAPNLISHGPLLLSALGQHWEMFLKKFTHLGEVSQWLQRGPKKKEIDAFTPTREGFYPLRHSMSDADWATFTHELGDPQPNPRSFGKGALPERETADLLALIRRTGARPIFFISPNALPTAHAQLEAIQRTGVPILAFDHPPQFPALFRRENRADEPHLNAQGAEILSRLLAEELAKISP